MNCKTQFVNRLCASNHCEASLLTAISDIPESVFESLVSAISRFQKLSFPSLEDGSQDTDGGNSYHDFDLDSDDSGSVVVEHEQAADSGSVETESNKFDKIKEFLRATALCIRPMTVRRELSFGGELTQLVNQARDLKINLAAQSKQGLRTRNKLGQILN